MYKKYFYQGIYKMNDPFKVTSSYALQMQAELAMKAPGAPNTEHLQAKTGGSRKRKLDVCEDNAQDDDLMDVENSAEAPRNTHLEAINQDQEQTKKNREFVNLKVDRKFTYNETLSLVTASGFYYTDESVSDRIAEDEDSVMQDLYSGYK